MLYLNHYLTLMLSASALVCQSLSAPTPDASLTPPGDVWIGDFTYGGTGCPDGTAWVGLSSDRSSFSAYFRKFVARTSGDITESRKFCQFNLALKSPPGWQYKIVQTSFSGYAFLRSGVEATHKSVVYFSGRPDEQSHSCTLRGPLFSNYNMRADFVVGDGQWSPCGSQALLNIKSVLNVDGNDFGEIRVIKESATVNQLYSLQWRTC